MVGMIADAEWAEDPAGPQIATQFGKSPANLLFDTIIAPHTGE